MGDRQREGELSPNSSQYRTQSCHRDFSVIRTIKRHKDKRSLQRDVGMLLLILLTWLCVCVSVPRTACGSLLSPYGFWESTQALRLDVEESYLAPTPTFRN